MDCGPFVLAFADAILHSHVQGAPSCVFTFEAEDMKKLRLRTLSDIFKRLDSQQHPTTPQPSEESTQPAPPKKKRRILVPGSDE